MLREVQERETLMHAERTNKKPFTLEVDISAMPRGELRFRNREFIEQAADEAEITQRTEITPENADRWGFMGRTFEAT